MMFIKTLVNDGEITLLEDLLPFWDKYLHKCVKYVIIERKMILN